MNEAERLKTLERVLAQMLQPVRDIPLSVIVKSLGNCEVIPIDKTDPKDTDLLNRLEQAARFSAADLRATPIRRPRPNEVGNDVEGFVMNALPRAGLTAARPTSKSGAGKATGYPDILVKDQHNRATYLECKSFGPGTADTSMRSFYLSPSDSFKVCLDARHLLLAFCMEPAQISGSRLSSVHPDIFQTGRSARPVVRCQIRVQL